MSRMLAAHIHCGQAMTLVKAHPVLTAEGQANEDEDDGQLMYRCACGFTFDLPRS
ncbi:hypothetical protein [Arthrobacter oryzae]|uniref:hypothetical protein n=1 Tax=Arthrobacter oryzae TaxID=409290 RepID=UPI0027D7813F|nr:hypothetical protein [Arthrobacter oryzae]